ncbi:MAG: DUF2059 domain-containing protein [Epsilonproteobacteria bacterium]|nr:DUF2059 domain-containing protein [Campylobacterota bacterium]
MVRFIKRVGAGILLASLLAFGAGDKKETKAANSEGIKAAYELFKTMHFKENLERTAKELTDVQILRQPTLQPYRDIIENFFKKYLVWDKLKKEMAKLYVKEFTPQELKKLNDFYKTPLGQKTLKVMPKLARESAAIWQKMVAKHIPELQKEIAKKAKLIEEAAKKLQQQKGKKGSSKGKKEHKGDKK